MDLTETQQKALICTMKKAQIFSDRTSSIIKMKFLEKYKNNELWNENLIPVIIDYILNADIIIHFKFKNLYPHFKNDTHYRNLFEVHTSGGSKDYNARSNWENNLFSNIYKDSHPSEKVKYGCINLYQSKRGCLSATAYGESYLILKKDIKKRCSFVCGDSSTEQPYLANFDKLNHLLVWLNDSTIENIIKIIHGESIKDDNYPYIEVQIHGDIIWNRDVEKIMINKTNILNEDMKQHIKNLNYDFF
jgi:hypothetical protein